MGERELRKRVVRELQICPANQPFKSDCLKSKSLGSELLDAASAQRFARSYAGVAKDISNFGVTGGIPRPYSHPSQSIESNFFSISLPYLSENQEYRNFLKSAVVTDLKRKRLKYAGMNSSKTSAPPTRDWISYRRLNPFS